MTNPIETITVHPDIIHSNKSRRQTAILQSAISEGLPKMFARDLYLDCEVISNLHEELTRTFGLLLRELGTQIAYDKDSAASASYWIDANDMQAFYIYRATPYASCTEDGKMERVSKREFREFLATFK